LRHFDFLQEHGLKSAEEDDGGGGGTAADAGEQVLFSFPAAGDGWCGCGRAMAGGEWCVEAGNGMPPWYGDGAL